MPTSVIEQELERLWKLSTIGRQRENHICIEDVNSAIQKALEELKKKRYCKQCGSNDEHSISCNSITRGYVYDEKDVNEFINSETSRNTDYSKMIKK